MNANELADELTKMFRGEEYDRLIHEIPNMLRKQQGAIEDLKNFYEDRIEASRKREETMMKTIESLLRKAQEK